MAGNSSNRKSGKGQPIKQEKEDSDYVDSNDESSPAPRPSRRKGSARGSKPSKDKGRKTAPSASPAAPSSSRLGRHIMHQSIPRGNRLLWELGWFRNNTAALSVGEMADRTIQQEGLESVQKEKRKIQNTVRVAQRKALNTFLGGEESDATKTFREQFEKLRRQRRREEAFKLVTNHGKWQPGFGTGWTVKTSPSVRALATNDSVVIDQDIEEEEEEEDDGDAEGEEELEDVEEEDEQEEAGEGMEIEWEEDDDDDDAFGYMRRPPPPYPRQLATVIGGDGSEEEEEEEEEPEDDGGAGAGALVEGVRQREWQENPEHAARVENPAYDWEMENLHLRD